MKFKQPLKEAIAINRPNRFIINALVDGKVETCHCPSTGNIGDILVENLPCLLSDHSSDSAKNRKTRYDVEALSLNRMEDEPKKWIGINQTRANSYVEQFIIHNELPNIISFGKGDYISREVNIGKSRLDFVINDNLFMEVKTPLVLLPLKKNYVTNDKIVFKRKTEFKSTDRFSKHVYELTKLVNRSGNRCILITFFMFEAERFRPPKFNESDSEIIKAIRGKIKLAERKGLEFWQVNACFDASGIAMTDYYRMELNE